MKTILVPVDLSPVTREVCDQACTLSKSSGGEIILFHVVTPPPTHLNGVGFASTEVNGMINELERRATRELLDLGRRCEKRSGNPVQVVQRTGSPVPAILSKASSSKAGMIVLGSHGHSAAFDLLVGSTAQAVLRRSEVPVLVVPMAPKKAGKTKP